MNNNAYSKSYEMPIEEIIKSVRGIIDNNNYNILASSEEDILELTDTIETSKENKADYLTSKNTANTITGLFKQFADTAKSVTEDYKKPNSVEELVVEMLRPQLKKWLDENLPRLVQNLIEKEIKRLIPGNKNE